MTNHPLVTITNAWCQLLERYGVLSNWLLVTPPHELRTVGEKDGRTLYEVFDLNQVPLETEKEADAR